MSKSALHMAARRLAYLVSALAMLFSAWTLCAFVAAFFDGSLMDQRLDDVAETAISIHADILTTALLLIVVMLLRRSLTAIGFAVPVVLSFALGAYDFQDFVINPFSWTSASTIS